jgi:hypothetical protein
MTTPHNPFAGETPFPLAGGEAILKFTTADIMKLYTLYGPDPREPMRVEPGGKGVTGSFWSTVLARAEMHDPHVLFNLLRLGLKQQNDAGKLVPLQRSQEWWDDLPFAWSEAAEIITTGLTWSRWFMTPEGLAQFMRQQAAAAAEAMGEGGPEDPPMGTTLSPTSSASVSEPTLTE